MLKGILGGGSLGLVVMGVSLGAASLVAKQPAGNAPPNAPVVDVPGIAATTPSRPSEPDLPARVADAGGAPQPSDTPQVGIDTAAAPLPETDTAPLATPDAAQTTAGLAPPPRETDGSVTVTDDVPVLPNPQAAAPQVPVQEADVRLETTTPPPPEPEPEPEPVIVAEDVAGPEAADDSVVAIIIAPEADTQPEPVPAADDVAENVTSALAGPPPVDVAIGDPQIAVEAQTPDPVVAAGDDVDVATATVREPEAPTTEAVDVTSEPAIPEDTVEADTAANAEPLPETVAEAEAEAEVDATVVIVAPETAPQAQDADPQTAPVVVSQAPEAPAGPRIALQGEGVTLPGADTGIRVTRPESEAEDTAEPQVAAPEVEVEADPAAPALERFAAPLNNPEGRPLMSVILIDDGSLAGAVPAVSSVPFDVSVAIDPTSEGAAERMAAYRVAGIEVVAIAVFPEGATPSDAEVALEAAFSAIPEAVALLDTGDAGLQDNRDLVEQAMARLAADGRGFITAAQGLNSGLRAADAASVPGGLIYRDLDSEDQTAQVIRRFLDQAAFRARQQSGVVLLGRVRADTLSALTLWGSANRAGQVTLAPISATLTGQ